MLTPAQNKKARRKIRNDSTRHTVKKENPRSLQILMESIHRMNPIEYAQIVARAQRALLKQFTDWNWDKVSKVMNDSGDVRSVQFNRLYCACLRRECNRFWRRHKANGRKDKLKPAAMMAYPKVDSSSTF